MKNIYEQVNERITGLLTQSLEGHTKTWLNAKVELFGRNPYSKHYYSMLNNFLLHIGLMRRHGYYLNRWITFLQAKELDAKIKKGSFADIIVFTSFIYLNDNGVNVTKQAQSMIDSGVELPRSWKKISFLKGYNVFNVADVEGLPAEWLTPADKVTSPEQRIQEVENLISNTGANINITATNQACYIPALDKINIPERWQFDDSANFYTTLFHELGHWTGHETRLNRKMSTNQQDYAFEELVAELTAAYCCARFDLPGMITNNAAYIKSWLKGLQNDMKFFTSAAYQAQKAADFIFNTQQEEERSAA